MIVLQAHAVAQSGGQVERLDVDRAIEKAGGADKLLAALGDRTFETVAPELSGAQVVVGSAAAILLAPVWVPALVVGGAILLPFALATGAFSNQQKIKNKEFPVGPGVENVGAELILGQLSQSREIDFIMPQNSWKGYLFFPRRSYTTLAVTAGAIDDLAERDKTVVQIDQGESPTLRYSETLRCPWRQG